MNLLALSVCVCFVMLEIGSAGAYDWDLSDEADVSNDENLITDKRYARLSYYQEPSSRNYRRRNRVSRYARLSFYRPSSLPRRYGWRRRYSSRMMPWDFLPRGFCLRKRCRSIYDCCQSHNLCDPNAKVCYDCWYGHPCSKDSDCCQRYPRCNRSRKTCTD